MDGSHRRHDRDFPLTAGARLGAGETVLIVDEEDRDCATVQQILTAEGFRTFKSRCIDEAMRVLGSHSADLVLLATTRPSKGGAADLQTIRNYESLRSVPVVMMGTRVTACDKAEAFAAGASGFVAKPFEEDELLAEVGRQLARGRSLAA